MAGLSIPIGGDMAPFLAVVADLRREMSRLGKSVRSTTSRVSGDAKQAAGGFRTLRNAGVAAMNGIATAARKVLSEVSSLGSKIRNLIPGGGMIGSLAGLAGVFGTLAVAISSLKTGADVAGNIEQTTIALEALTGSGETAKKMMDEMKATWLRTGASIEEQSGSIRKFVALGFSPEQAMQLQKNLMDVGGAVGMTTSETALLASALAQVKAKGVVSMEELRQQIAEKGIPVFETLAAKLGVTKGALIDMVSDGKVGADQLLDIFMNMEGSFSKFKGGADRMGFTFLGMVERLKGAWQLFLAEFAAPIIDNIKPMLAAAMDKLDHLKAKAAELGQFIGDTLLKAFALIQTGRTIELFKAGMALAINTAIDLFLRGLKSAVAFLSSSLSVIFKGLSEQLFTPATIYGVKIAFMAIAKMFGNELRASLPFADLEKIAKSNLVAEQDLNLGMANIKAGTSSFDLGKILADALVQGGTAARAAFGEEGDVAKKSKEEFQSILDSVSQVAAEMKAATAVPPAPEGDAPMAPVESGPMASKKPLETLTTALGRIGGGGFGISFSPMIAQQQQTNKLLGEVVKNTRSSQPKALPVI